MDGGGLGGDFPAKIYYVNNFGVCRTVYLSFYFGRGIFRVVCAGRNFADNLFVDSQRLIDCAGMFNLLLADKNFARPTFT